MDYTPSPETDPVILRHAGPSPTVSGLGGSYRVVRLLGRGTMASVYLAEQLSMARPVALKILSPALADDREFVERFHREARASARLNHPNIVAAIDFGEFESRFFLAMEFVDGATLSSILSREGILDEKRVLGIGLQVIAALDHAAEHGVIHLDIKPANIMIRKDGRVKLTDFGLAVLLDSPGAAEASRRAMGTPYYMAPEQVEGGKLDWRTDQFSLGASLYEAATGKKPFQGKSVSDILVKRFFEKPEPAWKAGRRRVSRSFSAVLEKMLARSPDRRYQSIEDLRTDFLRVQAGKKPAVARVASVRSPGFPSGSAWDDMDYGMVIGRVDGMLWQRRWTWCLYACALFLILLMVYGFLHGRELVGPTPPRAVRADMVAKAEALPPDLATPLRGSWSGAMRLLVRALTEPDEENYHRAKYSFDLIAKNHGGTVYAASARRWAAYLEKQRALLPDVEDGGQ